MVSLSGNVSIGRPAATAPRSGTSRDDAFGSGDDQLGKGPPRCHVGPGEVPLNRVGPPIEGLAADRAKCFVGGIEIQRDRPNCAAFVRASAIESLSRRTK